MIPPMNPQLAYIFKSQIFDKMPNVAEKDVASIARKWVGTAAKPGRFLRESSLFFLSRESGGVKGQMLLPPGATSLERAQQGEKGLHSENRPVIIPEYDYPGLPFDKLADFVATQAVLSLRNERAGSRLGPDLSQLTPAEPLTEVNSLDESGMIDTELIEMQRGMYKGYSERIIEYLWFRFKNPLSVNHMEGRDGAKYFASMRHLGYSSANGRMGMWEANGGIKVGITGDKPETIVQLNIKPLKLKNRLAYQHEIRDALTQVKKGLEAEGYAVLCMIAGANYMMHVTKGKGTPLTSAEVYQDLVENVGCKMVGAISSKKGVWAAKDLKFQSIKFTKESFIGDSKLPFTFPLSLHIMPTPSNQSKSTPNSGTNFFSPTESSGLVILPFDPSMPIKEGYDNHPEVVNYRAGEIMPIISFFYAVAGLLESLENPTVGMIEETTSKITTESLTSSEDYLMSIRRNIPKSIELEEVEGAQIVQVWNDGIECAIAAGEISFPGKITLTNLPQTYEARILAPKDVIGGILIGDSKEAIFSLIEESQNPIDEEHNFELLSRWRELTFQAHISPNQQIVGKMMGDTIRPARYGTSSSASEIHYDEIIRGDADGLMALFEDGTRGIAYAEQTIDTAVIGFNIDGKRAKNGEIGNVLLGVMSNERRKLQLETGKITRKEEIFSPVATLGNWVGFGVETRRKMIEHLSEHITHVEDGVAFVNPYSANVILRVQHKGVTDSTMKPVYRMYQREVAFEGPKFPGKSTGDPSLRLLQFGGKPDKIDAGAAVLKLHDTRLVPNIRGGNIIGLASVVDGLEEMISGEVKKVSPEYSKTGEGTDAKFLTGIPLAQIENPRPRYGRGRREEPINIFTKEGRWQAAAAAADYEPEKPYYYFNRQRVFDISTGNTKRVCTTHFLWRLGDPSRQSPFRELRERHKAITEYAMEKRRVEAEQWELDRPPSKERIDAWVHKFFQDALRNRIHKEICDNYFRMALQIAKTQVVRMGPRPGQAKAHWTWRQGAGMKYQLYRTWFNNPPVFDDPDAFLMGIQTDKGKTKWHNQLYKGKFSTIPEQAEKWKGGTFKNENTFEHWQNHLEEDDRPYVVSLKVDGDNNLAHFDGKETVIWNKRGRWRTGFHITDELTSMLKKHKVKSAKIMGELYAVGDDGKMLSLKENLSHILSPKTLERQNRIRFAAYDIIELDGKSMDDVPYSKRIMTVAGLVGGGETVGVVPIKQGKGSGILKKAWDEGMLEPQFEGLVLRFDDSPAKGKWSFKIKGFGTADLAVIGFYRGGTPEFTDDEGIVRRKGHKGRDAGRIGGAALAWMNEDGDFIYSGNSVMGASMKEKDALLAELLPTSLNSIEHEYGEKWGSHRLDFKNTHDGLGKGTMVPVKPTKIGEFQYRGINWGEKPVYRIKGKKIIQVGTVRAPTLFQPSFKRWRDDKDMTHQDLRMTQIPEEGSGKWGQIKTNPKGGYDLKPDFTPPEGFADKNCGCGKDPCITYGKNNPPITEAKCPVCGEDGRLEQVPPTQGSPARVGIVCPFHGLQPLPDTDFGPIYDSRIRYSPLKAESWSQILADEGWGRNPISPMVARGSSLMSFIYHEQQDVLAAQLYRDEAAAKQDKSDFLKSCKSNLEEKYGPVEVQTVARTNVCVKKGGKVGNIHNCGSPYLSTDMKQTRSADEGETTFIHCNLCLGKSEIKGNPINQRGNNSNWSISVSGDYIQAVGSNVNTGSGHQATIGSDQSTNQRKRDTQNNERIQLGHVATTFGNIEEDPYEELTDHVEKFLTNPPPKVMITVPHAAIDSKSNWIEHCTDWSAVPFAIDIRDKLEVNGANTTLLLSNTHRTIVDMNRIAAAETEFHKYLDNNIESYDILLDIHSFPDHYPAWKGYDIVLFTNDAEMPESTIEDTFDLAEHLTLHGLKVLIDQADTRNYIQIKAGNLGLRSHLIEVNEKLGTDAIAEVITDYFLLQNNPIREPGAYTRIYRHEIGLMVGPHGHVIEDGKSSSRGDPNSREIITVDNSPFLMNLYREFRVKVLEQKIRWIDALKSIVNMRRFPLNDEMKMAARGYGVPEEWKGKSFTIDEFGKKGGVCRHLGIVNAWLLERGIKDGWINGKVYYVRGSAHGWAQLSSVSGKMYVLDAAQSNWGEINDLDSKGGYQGYRYGDATYPTRNNPMAPGYQSYGWTTQDWRSIKVNNKGDIDYSEKCGAEGTRTASGKPRLCLPAPVVKSLMRSESGKEVIRKQARKKARAKKGESVAWHPRIKKLWKKLEDKTPADKNNPPRKPTVSFSKSPNPAKKIKAVFTYKDGRTKTTHFGAGGMSDYTIHKDPERKKRYIKRHRKNENWDDYTSAGSLSRYILWGEPTLRASKDAYLKRFGLKEVKSNSVLPEKRFGRFPVAAYIHDTPEERKQHKENKKNGKMCQPGCVGCYYEQTKSNPPEGITVMSAILRFDLPRIVPLVVGVELLEDVGFVLDRWGEGYKGGGFATLLVPKSITKENVRIKIQQNSKMVMLFSGHKVSDTQQENIRQLVYDAYEMKRNPSPNQPKTKRPRRLSTILSKTLMGDLIPFNYKDAIQKEKEAEKKRKAAEKKAEQDKKKGGQKGGQKQDTKFMDILMTNAKQAGKTEDEVKKAIRNSKVGKLDSFQKVKKVADKLGIQIQPKSNPDVYAVPQRITGNDGIWVTEGGENVTGQHYQGDILITGKPKPHISITNETVKAEPESKDAGYRIRFNMIKPSRVKVRKKGGKWERPDKYIISIETQGKHHYCRLGAEVKTILTLSSFPSKKSEPRLRPETFGLLSKNTLWGEIKIGNKTHELWNKIRVVGQPKNNPSHQPISLSKKKTLDNKMKKHNALQKSTIRQATNGAVEEAYRRGGMNRVNRFFKMLVAKNPPDDVVLEDADLMPEGHPVKKKAESLKRQSKSSGIVKPTEEMFQNAFGFPNEGGKFAGYGVEDFECRRIMVQRNQEYKFEWSIVLSPEKISKSKIEREMKKFSNKKEMLPSPKRLTYEVTAADEYTIDKLESNRIVITGHGRAFRIKVNPIGELDKDGELYINDHKPMTAKAQSSHYKREKLKGKIGSDAFMQQLAEKCQTFGEGSGYVKDGYLYFRRGSPLKNEVRVDGTMIEDATAFYHTHPAAWEPSQTSPEDFMVYHGMFTNLGMTDFFTVFGDRIDWFTFPKGEKFQAAEMAEIIEDFENDIEAVFNTSQEEFQDKMGDKPYLVPEQTRYINKMMCKCIPEYFAKYRCYELAPKNILKAARVNPPIETTQYHTKYLDELNEIKPVKLAHDGNATEAWIGKKRYALAEIMAARAARMVHKNDPTDQIDKQSRDWSVMSRNDMKDGMSWREARKFAGIAARRPHPAKEYTERMVVLHPDDYKGSGSKNARFIGEHDKLQMLKSYGLDENAVRKIREYLAGYTGKTSNFHILQMLNLYRNISKVETVDVALDEICDVKQTDGAWSIHMDNLSCEILKKLVRDRQDIASLDNMEKSQSRHGKHFIALALHNMFHAMLSPLDSPSSAFSGMEQSDYLSAIAQNLNRTLQTAEEIAV